MHAGLGQEEQTPEHSGKKVIVIVVVAVGKFGVVGVGEEPISSSI